MNAKLSIPMEIQTTSPKNYTYFLTDEQRRFADALPDAFVIIDQRGYILEWNSVSAQLSGLPYELVKGQHWRHIYQNYIQLEPNDKTTFVSIMESALASINNGSLPVIEKRSVSFVATDGQRRHGEYILFPLPHQDNPVLIGLLRDVTVKVNIQAELAEYQQHLEDMVDRRTAELQEANALLQMEIAQRQAIENELNRKNAQLEMIMNTASTPIYLKSSTGVILQVNQAFLDFYQLARDEVIGKNIIDACKAEHLQLFQETDSLFTGSSQHHATILTKDGVIRDAIFNRSVLVDDQGKYAGLVGVITDISDKLAIEKKLHNSRVWFDHCFNNNLYGICITRAQTGEFIDLNDTLLNQLGYTRETLIGNQIKDFNIWSDYTERERLLMHLDNTEFVINREVTFRGASGNLIPFLLSAQKFEFENDHYLFVVLNNVTDYIQAAKDFTRLDRLNIIGEMAASIGHEIRNPMTAVRGILQLYKNEYQHQPQSEIFNLLISEMDRANSIITEFLSLAPDKVSHPQLTSLNQILGSIYPLLMAEAISQEKHLQLQLESIPDIWLDPNEIRQLVVNLVKNGLEATPPKTMVRIKTGFNNDRIELFVSDEGGGISDDVIENMWKPFVTTKPDGTGLGLPVCYTIATRHQATIKVESGQNGTTFTVSFPLPWFPS